jgi:IMP dehydrogenase
MLGNLLAGTDESPGLVIMRQGQKMKVARGMASQEAAIDRILREDPARGWAKWELTESDVAPEGIQAPVYYRGSAREVLQQLVAGLRSGMSYCGATTVEQMWENAQFLRQTQAGIQEAGPHDVGSF